MKSFVFAATFMAFIFVPPALLFGTSRPALLGSEGGPFRAAACVAMASLSAWIHNRVFRW